MENSSELIVLVVDDDPEIRTILSSYLGSQGLRVIEAESEYELLQKITSSTPSVVLLDVNLGREDGFSIARRLRQTWHGGLIMITGRGDTVDRVVGLEIGADDYVAKPFDLRELLARIRSVSRRSNRTPSIVGQASDHHHLTMEQYYFDGYTLSVESRELCDERGTIIALTSGEFDLLKALVMNSGRVLSRDNLLQVTHNREAAPFDRTIDVQIGRLRKKLKDSTIPPRTIKSVRGQGYLFALDVKSKTS